MKGFLQKNLVVIKWVVLIILYILDFSILRLLEITFVSIGFLIDCILFSSLMFGVRRFFKYIKDNFTIIEKKLKKQ